ncbi:hypothetical protein SLS62_004421 [Diatrype stigma]|uniref:S-adenosylmethionine-dependent methyltransferase n=1 Tax=Diatrype stigma TaxID=117547 RepID=A0AAN9V4X4_9PEZI
MRSAAARPLLPPPPPPTSSLPPLRSLDEISEAQLFLALDNLYTLYCPPLPPSFAFQPSSPSVSSSCSEHRSSKAAAAAISSSSGSSTPVVADSGYASGDENEDEDEAGDGDDVQKQLHADGSGSGGVATSMLRADPFECAFAERWLTGFIARAEEFTGCFSSDDARERALEQAMCVLSSLFTSNSTTATEAEAESEDSTQITREFSFELSAPGAPSTSAAAVASTDTSLVVHDTTAAATATTTTITVRLNDGLAGARDDDHTDVGLQSWGASIVFSELMCASPARFGLVANPTTTTTAKGTPSSSRGPRIIELGAGTGLVSLVLATALPRLGAQGATVIATDYHPAVLANLRANIAANFPSGSNSDEQQEGEKKGSSSVALDACQLDWSDPVPRSPSPIDAAVPADVLVATDVVYAPEHATWLRACASRLLAPAGVFWLVATVRPSGKFEGISDTVRAAFSSSSSSPSSSAAPARGDDGQNGRVLGILGEEWLEKRKGVGRGDESGYRLFRIGWAQE